MGDTALKNPFLFLLKLLTTNKLLKDEAVQCLLESMFIRVRRHMMCYARRISVEGSKLENVYTHLLAMVVSAE